MKNREIIKRVITSIILIPFSFFLILFNKLSFYLFLFAVLIMCIYEWTRLFNKFNILNLLGYPFIFLSFYSAIYLKGNSFEESMFFLWIVTICIFSDIGGFIFGKLFGKNKITKISPNKTYEGAAGSLILGYIPALVILYYHEFNFDLVPNLLFLPFFISIVCQIGDISVSYFKRINNKKDTGNFLPGHGGVLDRLDGILFVLVFSYILKLINVI